jgi:hypothetical protein
MGSPGPIRPRVSRETRLLFTTVLVSIVALWVLARIRFPDRPATPNPVPTLLTQLAVRPRFEELAASVAELESRVLPALFPLEVDRQTASEAFPPHGQRFVPALRVRNDVVVALLGQAATVTIPQHSPPPAILARHMASGLAVIQVPPAAAPVLPAWSPQRLQYPRYFIVSDVSPEGASLRPVFVGALSRVTSVRWSESIWAAPAGSNLGPGVFVFTTDGTLAGLAIEHEGQPAILPAEGLMRAAERLLRDGSRGGGWLGLQVQGLTPAVASITGATGGVVVTWVDPEGPAGSSLRATDVVETIGGQPLSGQDDWDAHASRLSPGDQLLLGVRRAGEVQEIQLTAGQHPLSPPPFETDELGLTMRAVPRVGVEVVRADPGSAAARAGIVAGDVITLVGDADNPTPAEVTRAFVASPSSSALLVRVARGDRHHVLALEKR